MLALGVEMEVEENCGVICDPVTGHIRKVRRSLPKIHKNSRISSKQILKNLFRFGVRTGSNLVLMAASHTEPRTPGSVQMGKFPEPEPRTQVRSGPVLVRTHNPNRTSPSLTTADSEILYGF